MDKLVILSQSRTTGSSSSSSLTINFQPNVYLLGHKSVRPIYFLMYSTVYNLSSANNLLDFNDGSDHTATLTVGLWDGTSLASEIQTRMNAVSAGYTVTYNVNTKLFTVANATPFTLKFLTGTNTARSPFKEMGYTASNGLTAVDSGTGTSTSSPYPVNLALPLNIGIQISELGSQYVTSDNDHMTFVVPNTGPLGGVMTYSFRDLDQTICVPDSFRHIQQLHVSLVGRNGTQLNLNNSEWMLILQFVSTCPCGG